MSLSEISVQLACSLKFNEYLPKPSHHPKNTDVVIISTDLHDCTTQNTIYEYNLTQNTFNKMHTYKQSFDHYHGQFIDSKNELLYIFGAGLLGIFDLNTKVM
eukprot:66827_1